MDILYSLIILSLISIIWIGVIFLSFKKMIRNQNKRDERMLLIGLLLFLAMIFIVASGTVAFEYMESEDFCGTFCHIMIPYHNSYLYPGNNSMMAVHLNSETSCTNCHNEPGIIGTIDSLYTGMKEMYLYYTNTYNPEDLGGDITRESCLKCHDGITAIEPRFVTTAKGKVANPHSDETKCTDCHNAHYSGIGLSENTCSICHGIFYENFEEMLLNHALRTNKDCMQCHNRPHPDDALIPFTEYPDLIDTEFCSDCHGGDVERLNSRDHETESCLNCHNEHDSLNINFDDCYGSCHDEATGHDSSTTSCSICHDTTTIHLPPDFDLGLTFSNIVCDNCHAEESSAYESSFIEESLEIYGEDACINCHSEHQAITYPHKIESPFDDCGGCHILYNEGIDLHDRTQISYLNFLGISKDFCSDCHNQEFTRLNRQLHNEFNCIDCHNEHKILGVDFNNCISCHDSPSDHDTTLTSCSDSTCHDRLRSIHSII